MNELQKLFKELCDADPRSWGCVFPKSDPERGYVEGPLGRFWIGEDQDALEALLWKMVRAMQFRYFDELSDGREITDALLPEFQLLQAYMNRLWQGITPFQVLRCFIDWRRIATTEDNKSMSNNNDKPLQLEPWVIACREFQASPEGKRNPTETYIFKAGFEAGQKVEKERTPIYSTKTWVQYHEGAGEILGFTGAELEPYRGHHVRVVIYSLDKEEGV